jgi:hypothetical protein
MNSDSLVHSRSSQFILNVFDIIIMISNYEVVKVKKFDRSFQFYALINFILQISFQFHALISWKQVNLRRLGL